MLGGGSSINGQFFNRGAPSDYDDWAARGVEGWDWESVLPYFKKIERDIDFDGPLHGRSGPFRCAGSSRMRGRSMRTAVGRRAEGIGLRLSARPERRIP